MRKSIPEWSEVIPRTPDRAIIDGMVRRLYTAGVIRGARRRHPMELLTIGIDLGKTVFHMVGCDAQSRRGLYSQ